MSLRGDGFITSLCSPLTSIPCISLLMIFFPFIYERYFDLFSILHFYLLKLILSFFMPSRMEWEKTLVVNNASVS